MANPATAILNPNTPIMEKTNTPTNAAAIDWLAQLLTHVVRS
jgi:hypothetical protein